MKDITPLLKEGKKRIDAYGNGGFVVSGERFEGNIIILPDSAFKTALKTIESSKPDQLNPILSAVDIEVLLVGCGAATEFFPDEIEQQLKSRGISVEYMNTGAAARTYNVLLTEERKVAVVLIAV